MLCVMFSNSCLCSPVSLNLLHAFIKRHELILVKYLEACDKTLLLERIERNLVSLYSSYTTGLKDFYGVLILHI